MKESEQLLAMLEQLVGAVEAVSDLPESIEGETMGVRTRTPRRDFICKGYSYSEGCGELAIARMLSSVLFALAFGGERRFRLRAAPDQVVVRDAGKLTLAYYEAHPVATESEETC